MFNPVKVAKERKATIAAYRAFFKTKDGQLVLHDLMKSCGYTGSVMGKDALETAYNEGQRSIVLRIFQTIQASPEQIAKHLKVIQDKTEEQYE